MKNIHLLPTDKPSRLFKDDFGKLIYSINMDQEQNHFEPQHLFIISDEEIKEGDWIFNEEREPSVLQCIGQGSLRGWNKIILTTDSDLIKDGVQPIDDEFLEWFVNNPSCEEVEVYREGYKKNGMIDEATSYQYKIIIPKEEPKCTCKRPGDWDCVYCVAIEPKQETLEEFIKIELEGYDEIDFSTYERFIELGAKWQAERMYSEEEVLNILFQWSMYGVDIELDKLVDKLPSILPYNEWFEQFKKK